jgi:hypothetical protein
MIEYSHMEDKVLHKKKTLINLKEQFTTVQISKFLRFFFYHHNYYSIYLIK